MLLFSLFDEVCFYVTVIVIDCQFKESIGFVVAKVPDCISSTIVMTSSAPTAYEFCTICRRSELMVVCSGYIPLFRLELKMRMNRRMTSHSALLAWKQYKRRTLRSGILSFSAPDTSILQFTRND